MNLDILLKEFLENFRSITKKLEDISKALADNAVNDTKHEFEINALKEAIENLKLEYKDMKNSLRKLEVSKTELAGFAKYVKLIWIVAAAVAGYLMK